jgi:hypothetical protein
MLSNRILFLLILLIPKLAFPQLKIDCGSVKQVIPTFKSDSVQSFDNFQSLEKLKIIPSLKQSKSPVEIRILYFGVRLNVTIIIRCKGDNVLVDRYEVNHIGAYLQGDTSFKKIAEISTNESLFVKHDSCLKLKYPETWNLFFKELIDNHFFNLPKEDVINKAVFEKYPDADDGASDGTIFYEAKVGTHYRNVMYTNFYNPKANTIPFVKYRLNIEKLFIQFYRNYEKAKPTQTRKTFR